MPAKKKAKGLYLSELSEMSHEIDVKYYLGEKPTSKQIRLFAELAVDTIKTRTLDGQTINGGKFKKYSKKYADFKGVTQDSVDLFLEGDMLDSVNYETKDDSVKIYVESDQVPKSYNHNEGDTLPKRPWFGLTDSEASQIANQLKDSKETRKFTLDDLRSALDLLGIEQTE